MPDAPPERPFPVRVIGYLVGVPAALALGALLGFGPSLLPYAYSVSPLIALGAPLLLGGIVVGAAGLWDARRWALWTLAIASSLVGAAALLTLVNGLDPQTLLVLLASGAALALATSSASREWTATTPRPPVGWALAGLLVNATLPFLWILATLPLSSLYTSADGATLPRDALLAILAAAPLGFIGALELRRRGTGLAPWIVAAGLGVVAGLALILHARNLTLASLSMDVVQGFETELAIPGVALVLAAIATLVATRNAPDRAATARLWLGASLLATSIATLILVAYTFPNAPELQALAESRHRTPGPSWLVVLATLGLIALVRRRAA